MQAIEKYLVVRGHARVKVVSFVKGEGGEGFEMVLWGFSDTLWRFLDDLWGFWDGL